MYKLNVNEKWSFDFENDAAADWDLIEYRKGQFHLIKNGKSTKVELLSVHEKQKNITLKVNGNEYTVNIKDKYDLLLQKLGMELPDADQISEIRAPMPGLVTRLIASPGDSIEKGTQVLVLEAMKMENVLKSPGSGVIKSFAVSEGDAVEKNQVMVILE